MISIDNLIREAENSEQRIRALEGVTVSHREVIVRFGQELTTQAKLIGFLAQAVKESRPFTHTAKDRA